MQGRVLVVGLERSHYKDLLPLLSRALLNVDRLSTGESAAELASQVAIDLVVIRHPLPDMAIGSFMQSLHQAGSPCEKTPILVVADDNRLTELASMLPGGAGQAVSVNQPEKLLAHVALVLKLAPRADVRIAVRLEVKLDGGTKLIICQSENISEKGMLLRTDARFPIGSKVRFDFTLPGDQLAVQGEADVVRHAEPPVEGLFGMGLKVNWFKGDGGSRIRRHVLKQTPR
jgi:CheY-like chemotaxis protein